MNDHPACTPTEEVQRYVGVLGLVSRANNVLSIATVLRVHVILNMVILGVGMLLHINPWFIAWTMLALTLLHASFMWRRSTQWQLQARQADDAFAKWLEEREDV